MANKPTGTAEEPKTMGDVPVPESADIDAEKVASTDPEPKEDAAPQMLTMTQEQLQKILDDQAAKFEQKLQEMEARANKATEEVEKVGEKVVKRLTAAQEASLEQREEGLLKSKALTESFESDRERMKRVLDAQPKVRTFVPTEGNEIPGKSLLFVCINHYEIFVPKGVFIYVPEQVDRIIKDSLHIPETLGLELRLDLNTGKAEKLLPS